MRNRMAKNVSVIPAGCFSQVRIDSFVATIGHDPANLP
jgi:hypothetical protein